MCPELDPIKKVHAIIGGLVISEYIYNEHNEFENDLKVWKRSNDLVYILWSSGQESLDCFFWRVNNIALRMQFTRILNISIKHHPNILEKYKYRN